MEAPAAGDDAEWDQENGGKPRRYVSEIQLEMANKGALFIDFEVPTKDPAGDPIEHTNAYKVCYGRSTGWQSVHRECHLNIDMHDCRKGSRTSRQ